MKYLILILTIAFNINSAKAESDLSAPKPESFCKTYIYKVGKTEFKSIMINKFGKCEVDQIAYTNAIRNHKVVQEQLAKGKNRVEIIYDPMPTENAYDVKTLKAENSHEREIASFMADKISDDIENYKKDLSTF